MRRLEAGAILFASFGLAAFVVARKGQVEHLLSTLGPFAMPLAVVILAVVASAPFSATDALAEDSRFKNHGLAPKSAADFAFLLHGLHFLKDDGVMAIILPHDVLSPLSGRE